MDDSEELAEDTDPNNADSDGDGALDGEEIADGTDPNDASSGGADPVLPTSGFWKFDSLRSPMRVVICLPFLDSQVWVSKISCQKDLM